MEPGRRNDRICLKTCCCCARSVIIALLLVSVFIFSFGTVFVVFQYGVTEITDEAVTTESGIKIDRTLTTEAFTEPTNIITTKEQDKVTTESNYSPTPEENPVTTEGNYASTTEPNPTPIVNETTAIVCKTDECIKSAAALLFSMNPNVDPCDDFYEYACGGWIKNNPISGTLMKSKIQILGDEVLHKVKDILEETSTASTIKPLSNARSFYKYCMIDESDITTGRESFLRLFRTLGLHEFPFIEAITSRSGMFTYLPYDKTLARTERYLDDSIFFQIDVIPHLFNNHNKSVIKLDRATPSSAIFEDDPLRTYFTDEKSLADSMEQYIQTYSRLIYNREFDIKEEVKALARFTIKFQELQDETEFPRYNTATLAQLQAAIDSKCKIMHSGKMFTWMDYICEIYPGIEFSSKDQVIVRQGYFEKLWKLLKEHSIGSKYYIWWRIFTKVAPFNADVFYKAKSKYVEFAIGRRAPPRWMDCAKYAIDVYGFAIGNEYVKKYFKQTDRKKTQEIANGVKMAFGTTVKNLDWMDDGTKAFAVDKINDIATEIGYPDWILLPGKLEQYYDFIPMHREDRFTSFLQYLIDKNSKKLYKLFLTPPRHAVDEFPTTLNSNYWIDNEMTLPAAMLQFPLYGLGLDALNYGSIGSIIGHELTHSLDDRGRFFNKFGKAENWWKRRTGKQFKKRAACFTEQYQNYFHELIGDQTKRNARYKLEENIADNGGVRHALKAFETLKAKQASGKAHYYLPSMEEFSERQLFFLSYANMWCSNESPNYQYLFITSKEHSPTRIRVLGTLSNMKEFADTWKCPAGSRMNPKDKCVLW